MGKGYNAIYLHYTLSPKPSRHVLLLLSRLSCCESASAAENLSLWSACVKHKWWKRSVCNCQSFLLNVLCSCLTRACCMIFNNSVIRTGQLFHTSFLMFFFIYRFWSCELEAGDIWILFFLSGSLLNLIWPLNWDNFLTAERTTSKYLYLTQFKHSKF